MENKINIGIDLGGSHVAIGVVDINGNIIEKCEKDFTVEEKKNLIEVAKQYIVNNILKLKEKYNFSEFGIGVPGTTSEGIIVRAVNLGIENYNLEKVLEAKTNCKVKVKNDTKCAAIAEYMFGCCQDDNNVLFLTLGTGIGGAYIYQGNLMTGSIFEGFEFGHMIIKENGLECKCGKKGCFEKYGSILAFKTKIIEHLNLSYDIPGPELREIIVENKNKVKFIIDEYIQNLAIGLSNLINIFEPDSVVLGGGFARYDYILLQDLQDYICNSNLLFNKRENINFKIAKLGNDAGIVGASMLKN